MADEIISLLKYEPKKNIKICHYCETENPDTSKNCCFCGKNLDVRPASVTERTTIKPRGTEYSGIKYTPPVKPTVEVPYTPPVRSKKKKKKNNTGIMIMIIVLSVILSVFGTIFLYYQFNNPNHDDSLFYPSASPANTLTPEYEEEEAACEELEEVAVEEVAVEEPEEEYMERSETNKEKQTVKYLASSICPGVSGFTYEPGNAFDGDSTTAWLEGASGDGIGEYVAIQFDKSVNIKSFKILNGYAKNEKTYFENGRPEIIKAVIKTSENDTYQEIMEFENTDKFTDETSFKCSETYKNVTKIYFYIEEAVSGSKYTDTSITDIKIYDENNNLINGGN